MQKIHFRKLENMYLNAPINSFYDPTISVTEGKAEITIDITEKFFHAAKATHGSVYFKMLDDAAFFAANSLIEDVFVLTTSFNINLLKPIFEGTIRSVGSSVFSSNQLMVAEAKLFDGSGKEIAIGTGNFTRSKIVLSEEMGYKE